MLIDCPGCAKSYHISRAALGRAGRNVACQNCLTSWFAAPDAKDIADPASGLDEEDSRAPEITVEAISERARQPTYEELYGEAPKAKPAPMGETPHIPRLPRTAIAIPAALAIAMGLIGDRGFIVKLWPQTNTLLALAGLPVNAEGFDLRHVRVNLVHDEGRPLLVVDGEIANQRDESYPVPDLRLEVRDAAGHEVYAWNEASPKAKLARGETVSFRARLAAPPAEGHDVFVRFASAEKAAR